MSDPYDDCTKVTDFCVVEETIYGYYPNLGANVFFLVIFAICGIVQLYQGFRWRTRSFLIAMGLGCLTECIGYVGRILLHDNPWSDVGFEMQICCIIIAPVCLHPPNFDIHVFANTAVIGILLSRYLPDPQAHGINPWIKILPPPGKMVHLDLHRMRSPLPDLARCRRRDCS